MYLINPLVSFYTLKYIYQWKGSFPYIRCGRYYHCLEILVFAPLTFNSQWEPFNRFTKVKFDDQHCVVWSQWPWKSVLQISIRPVYFTDKQSRTRMPWFWPQVSFIDHFLGDFPLYIYSVFFARGNSLNYTQIIILIQIDEAIVWDAVAWLYIFSWPNTVRIF